MLVAYCFICLSGWVGGCAGVFEIRLDLGGEEKKGGAYVRYSVTKGKVDGGIIS